MRTSRSLITLLAASTLSSSIVSCGVVKSSQGVVQQVGAAALSPMYSHISETALPPGFADPNLAVGSRSGSGLWFWSNSRTASDIFFVNAPGSPLKEWSTGPSLPPNPSTGGIGVDSKGNVWLGLGLRLFHLDSASGTVKVIAIAAPKTNNLAAERFRPPQIRIIHGVEALAVSAGGIVAMSVSLSSQIDLYNPATRTFSTLQLPTSTDANSLSFLANGTLVAGLDNYSTQKGNEVLLSTPGGRTDVVTVADSEGVTASGKNIVVGVSQPEVLSSSAGLTGATSSVTETVARISLEAPIGVSPKSLPDGQLAAVNGGSILILNAQSLQFTKQIVIPKPDQICIPTLPAGAKLKTLPTGNSQCSTEPRSLETDGVGDVWFTGSYQGYVSELAAS